MQYYRPVWLPAAVEIGQKDYYVRLNAEVIATIPEGCMSVLDVGCARGTLGRWLKENGVRTVSGVEFMPAVAAEAQRWLDQVVVGDIERVALPFPDGAFDCIVCSDVLEHLVDPWAVVGRLKRLLAPNGCIVASIPNVGFHRNLRKMIRGEWHYAADGLLDRTHLRFFTLQTIEDLFYTNGMRLDFVLKKVNAGWNIRVLNMLLLGALRHTLYLHYTVRAQVR